MAVAGSFRDPAGTVFTRGGVVFRQVHAAGRADYDRLIQSGLYERLTDRGLLIPHTEEPSGRRADRHACPVLRPEPIAFISYPYEWCFSQLKDAALATLAIQEEALARGMSLKDSSAYNIQFRGCRPVWIDTLSFEPYQRGRPWSAYRQFCEHFLAPLALMSEVDARLGQLCREHIDGIPLDLASTLLPLRTRFRFSLLSHVHLHARAQVLFAGRRIDDITRQMSLSALRGLIDALKTAIDGLTWQPPASGWADYDGHGSYAPDAMAHKIDLVRQFLNDVPPGVVWDLGANTGRFSRLAAEGHRYTVAFDADHGATERHYLSGRSVNEATVLPLVVDLASPSPAIGWAHRERASWIDRGPADTVLALALVHHLAIGNGVPLARIAECLAAICTNLIVEWVPKDDPQARRLLAARPDVFSEYSATDFERAFAQYFSICRSAPIRRSRRVMYSMRRR